MAVDDLSRRVLYVGDGSSTEFAFNFVVFVATDVAVYTKDEEGEDKLISPSNYTVTLNENQDNNPGGVVKFNSAPADEAVIAVVSAVPETQPMVLTTYDGFDPEVLNKSADRAVSLIQQLSDDVDRAIKLPRTSQKTTAAAYEELAGAAEKANEALALMDETLEAATEVMDALRDAGDVTGATQVVAAGATTARSVASKLADTMTIADFGATADGVTDDTQAMVRADASGCKTLDLRGATVATNYLPENISLKNGYLVYRGQFFNVDGAKTATGGLLAHRHIADLAVYNSDGTGATTYPSRSAQGIGYLNEGGVERVFMAYRSYGVSNSKAYQMGSIVEYRLANDGDTLDVYAQADYLPMGHCQGIGVRKASNGDIFLYATASSLPDRFLSGSTNYGKGFSRIHWKGASTTAADVVNYRVLPYYISKTASAFDTYAQTGIMTPTVTPDGKKIILISGVRCFIYDLAEIEACTAEDNVYTWADAGVADPYTDSESASAKQHWSLPASQIDASSVKPLAVFPLDNSTARSLQGVASDGTFIYVSCGAENANSECGVEVYDFTGKLVRIIWHQGARALYTRSQLEGGDPDLGVMLKNENEGLFVRGDQLVNLMFVRWNALGDIVTYGGANYIAVKQSTGAPPDAFANNYWMPTRLAATKGAWSATVTYAPGAWTGNRLTEARRLVAVEPFVNGDEAQIPLPTNAHNINFHHQQLNEMRTTLRGSSWGWGIRDPYSGLIKQVQRIDATGTYRVSAYWADADSEYGDIGIKDQAGNIIASVVLRGYGSTDPKLPGILRWMYIDANGVANTLAQMSSKGFWVRANTDSSKTTFGIFSPNANFPNGMDRCLKVNVSSTGTYCSAINRNLILNRVSYDADTDTYSGVIGVWLTRTNFAPQFYSGSAYQSITLGSASAHWSEVFADTGSINTSDERKKGNIADPDEALMRAWGRVNFKVFQFKDALEKKGDAARLHVGLIAQQVREAFAAEGLDADRYGLFCYDKWEAKPAETDPKTGEVIEPAVEAGDSYGIRYDEALALECAYQRWRLAKIEEKLG